MRKLTLPNWIKIGPYDCEVKFVRIEEGEGRLGDYSSRTNMIRIDSSMSDRRRIVETLLHEVLHAIYYSYTLSPGDGEERVVSVLSTGLAAVLRDNPEFTALLAKELPEKYSG